MTCMTFDEVGAPARLSGGPSPATNIPVVHTLLLAIQSTIDFRAREASKKVWEEREGYSDHPRPNIVQIGPVVQALEQFSRMQSEREQTLVNIFPEICAFIIGFSSTVWTKMRPLLAQVC